MGGGTAPLRYQGSEQISGMGVGKAPIRLPGQEQVSGMGACKAPLRLLKGVMNGGTAIAAVLLLGDAVSDEGLRRAGLDRFRHVGAF